MVQRNLVKCYEQAFRENREMTALTDYFKKENFSYYEMAKEIAKLHLLFEKAGIQPDDKIALMGRNNPRWCIAYIATITYGAILVPILQDFNANDVINILQPSQQFLNDGMIRIIIQLFAEIGNQQHPISGDTQLNIFQAGWIKVNDVQGGRRDV